MADLTGGAGTRSRPHLSHSRRSDSHDHLVATGAPAPIRRGSASRRKQLLAPYLFVLPFFVVFVAMLVVPLGYAAWTSLFRSRLIGGKVFAGLDNYTSPTRPGLPRGLAARGAHPARSGADHARPLVFALVLDNGLYGTRALRAHLSSCRMRCRCRRDPHVGLPLRSRFGPIGQASGRSVSRRPASSGTEHARRSNVVTRRLLATTW